MSVIEDECCPVCQTQLLFLPDELKQRHIASCLDGSLTASMVCPICKKKDLGTYTVERRAAHVNRCLERLDEKHGGEISGVEYRCPYCRGELNARTLPYRVAHLKQCARNKGSQARPLLMQRDINRAALVGGARAKRANDTTTSTAVNDADDGDDEADVSVASSFNSRSLMSTSNSVSLSKVRRGGNGRSVSASRRNELSLGAPMTEEEEDFKLAQALSLSVTTTSTTAMTTTTASTTTTTTTTTTTSRAQRSALLHTPPLPPSRFADAASQRGERRVLAAPSSPSLWAAATRHNDADVGRAAARDGDPLVGAYGLFAPLVRDCAHSSIAALRDNADEASSIDALDALVAFVCDEAAAEDAVAATSPPTPPPMPTPAPESELTRWCVERRERACRVAALLAAQLDDVWRACDAEIANRCAGSDGVDASTTASSSAPLDLRIDDDSERR